MIEDLRLKIPAGVEGYRVTSLISKLPPQDPTVGLRLRPHGGPMGLGHFLMSEVPMQGNMSGSDSSSMMPVRISGRPYRGTSLIRNRDLP